MREQSVLNVFSRLRLTAIAFMCSLCLVMWQYERNRQNHLYYRRVIKKKTHRMDEEELMLAFLLVLMLCFNVMIYRLMKPGRGRGDRLEYNYRWGDLIICFRWFLLTVLFANYRFRRWWRRPTNRLFSELSEFERLFSELKITDHEELKKYARMTPEQFQWLLDKVTPFLRKRSARRPFPPELRLAFTLGFVCLTFLQNCAILT